MLLNYVPKANAIRTARSCRSWCAGEYGICSVAEPQPITTRKNVPTNSASTARQKPSDSLSRLAVPCRPPPPHASAKRRPTSWRHPASAGLAAARTRPAVARQRPSSRGSRPRSSRARPTASRSRATRTHNQPVPRRRAAATRRPTDARLNQSGDSSSPPTDVISASGQFSCTKNIKHTQFNILDIQRITSDQNVTVRSPICTSCLAVIALAASRGKRNAFGLVFVLLFVCLSVPTFCLTLMRARTRRVYSI